MRFVWLLITFLIMFMTQKLSTPLKNKSNLEKLPKSVHKDICPRHLFIGSRKNFELYSSYYESQQIVMPQSFGLQTHMRKLYSNPWFDVIKTAKEIVERLGILLMQLYIDVII